MSKRALLVPHVLKASEIARVRFFKGPGNFDRTIELHDTKIDGPLVRGVRFDIDTYRLTVLVWTPVA